MRPSDAETLIGGWHAVSARLESPQGVTRVWLAGERREARAERVRQLAKAAGIEVTPADTKQLDAMLPDTRHQGCIAACKAPPALRESKLPALLASLDTPWVLALDQVQDPHNLGACLRSAAAAGVSAVIAPRKRAAGLTAAVRRVAAGAAERVPFVPVTNLARALTRLQDDGFWVVGLDGAARGSIYATDLPQRLVLVAGGEANGLRELTARHCDLRVAIPMASGVESLNVSVATGVALFEAIRQHRARTLEP